MCCVGMLVLCYRFGCLCVGVGFRVSSVLCMVL